MKVAMFTDSYHPTVDGAVVSMERQCRGLEARGHEITILAPDTPSRADGRWQVHYLPSMEFRSYRDYRIVVSPSDMLEYLRSEEVDIIHCHGLASMAILSLTAARALRLPSVLTFHTMANEAVKHYSFIGLRDDLLVPLVWVYLRNLLRRPDMVVFPSTPIAEEILGHGIKPKACEVIPTGVDCAEFSPENRDASVLTDHGLDDRQVVLHVGRLSREKRFDIILRAMAELKSENRDLRLLVMGSGPAEHEYRMLSKKLGLSQEVVFAGFVSDDILAKAYATCDVLALASTFETQGLVILEAMASGTPVAGMRCRAIPEFVRDGYNGCLFGPDTCADGIRRCLGGANEFSANAIETARQYSTEACSEKLEKAYEQAAVGKRSRMS
ncbi:MAG: glycosyltransferase [Methanobacteriota archaeon]|nr:MAG: glycosyltransferase [Euryarchaeota archaeon]